LIESLINIGGDEQVGATDWLQLNDGVYDSQ